MATTSLVSQIKPAVDAVAEALKPYGWNIKRQYSGWLNDEFLESEDARGNITWLTCTKDHVNVRVSTRIYSDWHKRSNDLNGSVSIFVRTAHGGFSKSGRYPLHDYRNAVKYALKQREADAAMIVHHGAPYCNQYQSYDMPSYTVTKRSNCVDVQSNLPTFIRIHGYFQLDDVNNRLRPIDGKPDTKIVILAKAKRYIALTSEGYYVAHKMHKDIYRVACTEDDASYPERDLYHKAWQAACDQLLKTKERDSDV